MKYLRVKNWENFQHYKDRSPPWIKLHRDLLRDYHFLCLQDASKMQLMLIWLLASQLDNKIPADPIYIKNQIGIKGELNLKELINNGFLIDDSNLLASCKQTAIVETETETETEAYRTDREETEKTPTGFCLPDWIDGSDWKDFEEMRRKQKKPMTDRARGAIVKKLATLMQAGHDPSAILENSIRNGWQDVFEPKNQKESPNGKTRSQLADEAAERALRRLEDEESANLLLGSPVV